MEQMYGHPRISWRDQLQGSTFTQKETGFYTTHKFLDEGFDYCIDYCRRHQLQEPVYNEMSDRRGGRTAWSSIVIIGLSQYPARYWYDGDYIENAREDAAEMALKLLQYGTAHHSGT